MDTNLPDAEVQFDLDKELEGVQRRLKRQFPAVGADELAAVIDEAAAITDGAKIQTFRPLLIEHRASDLIRSRRSA